MASNLRNFYGAEPYRSRDGLSTRQAGGSDEIQLRIDPMDSDLDDEISGLLGQATLLKHVTKEIGSEGKLQSDLLHQLEMTLTKAQAGVKNNMRKLNKSIVKEGSSHVMHVVLFALLCFFFLYLCSKWSRR